MRMHTTVFQGGPASCTGINTSICWLLLSCKFLKASSMTYTMESTADKGRCIRTTASLRWGDVVLEQAPYTAVAYDNLKDRCHYSFEAAETRK